MSMPMIASALSTNQCTGSLVPATDPRAERRKSSVLAKNRAES